MLYAICYMVLYNTHIFYKFLSFRKPNSLYSIFYNKCYLNMNSSAS